MCVTISACRRWPKRRWTFAAIPPFTASSTLSLIYKSWDRATVGTNADSDVFIQIDRMHGLGRLTFALPLKNRQKRINKLLSLIIWSSACVMGAVFAIVLMGLVWDRFQTTPTITTVETNNYPIWNVPFPAITICNINKVYAPATKNITDKLCVFFTHSFESVIIR